MLNAISRSYSRTGSGRGSGLLSAAAPAVGSVQRHLWAARGHDRGHLDRGEQVRRPCRRGACRRLRLATDGRSPFRGRGLLSRRRRELSAFRDSSASKLPPEAEVLEPMCDTDDLESLKIGAIEALAGFVRVCPRRDRRVPDSDLDDRHEAVRKRHHEASRHAVVRDAHARASGAVRCVRPYER